MRLRLISEATTKWAGPLHNYLGSGEPYTVNYGTADGSRSPLLYIQVPLSDIRALIKRVQKGVVWFDDESRRGGVLFGDRRAIVERIKSAIPDACVVDEPRPRHTGEAHITLIQDFLGGPNNEMADAVAALCRRGEDARAALSRIVVAGKPLFDRDGRGMKTPVTFGHDFTVWRSFGYRDEYDPSGPLQVSLSVKDGPYRAIRAALGLRPTVQIPGSGATWIPHVGIGYIANRSIIDKSYVDKTGHRQRRTQMKVWRDTPE